MMGIAPQEATLTYFTSKNMGGARWRLGGLVDARSLSDRLDIESLLHVGAAVAQNLDDFVLIVERIEVRLDGLWLSYYLAERERGGKILIRIVSMGRIRLVELHRRSTRNRLGRASIGALLAGLGRPCRVVQPQLAVAGELSRPRWCHNGPRSCHHCAGREDPGFGRVFVPIQNHGPSMDSRNHRDMDAWDHTRMHARDNAGMNERHRVNPNHRLHPSDRHDAVDMPHIVRLSDVLVLDPAYVVVLRPCDITITRAGYVAISVDIAYFRHGLVPIDRTHICTGDRRLAVHSVYAPRLGRHWDRDDHRAHQSYDTS